MDETRLDDAVARVRGVFDAVADDYDQSGVDFFAPIAGRLLAALDAQPGERALDVGCGRGAVTRPLALAVGATGSVTAIDVSSAMVEHTRAVTSDLSQVTVEVMDASRPTLPEASYDVLASSLVLFFLPDPTAAVTRWLRLLRPGGRVGVTTFGEQDATWKAVDALFRPHLPPQLLDPRVMGPQSPYGSDEGVAALLSGAGAVDVHTVREPLDVVFASPDQWRSWSMGTGQRAFWGFVPAAERPALFEQAAALLETARDGDGRITLHQDVRVTVAHVPGVADSAP